MTIQQIQAATEYMDVIDVQGKPHHIILMTVPQSMRSYKLVKEFGDGVDRMVYATIRQNKDASESNASEGRNDGQLNGQLNESQMATLEYIRQHEGYNTTMIAKGLDKPFRTVDKHIKVLLVMGHIERRGSKRSGGYYMRTKN